MERFGYLDADSNYSLVYETGEDDSTLYPGIYILQLIHMESGSSVCAPVCCYQEKLCPEG